MDILRTPDDRFENLPDYPFAPSYRAVGPGLRLHYLDEGPPDAPPVLLLHGEPSWSYVYRAMIPPLVARGHRVLAPDLIGFGRSDKPAARSDYTFERHVDWMSEWLTGLDLRGITLFCQDWGSLIGLRMAAAAPQRFDRIVLANGGLPAIDCLPDVVAAAGDVPVLFDSGVRSGADVVKALALGAKAVGIDFTNNFLLTRRKFIGQKIYQFFAHNFAIIDN